MQMQIRKKQLIRLWIFIPAMVFGLACGAAFAASSDASPLNPRMSQSTSPYLRLHSGDLVQWYSWGDEAFSRARELDRPLMVSFGYFACHWCHVMQETHFTQALISGFINDNFVPVLVDRERRTALDETYMLASEITSQSGGWPNTVFITPDLKPLYGTGYIPPEPFTQLMQAVHQGWIQNRAQLVGEAERLAAVLSEYQNRREAALAITPELLATLSKGIVEQFDPLSGGMGEAPKFFQAPVLLFLLQRHERDGDTTALEAVERTLSAVASGGIHDQLEGGFHRYAVDPGWRIPHFEKMLYDQAQMAEVFLEAFRLTGNKHYAETARKTLDYVLNDLTAPGGGFYTTRDADSQGEEGTYYVWSPDQLSEVLGAEGVAEAINMFGIIGQGEFSGKIILNLDDVDADALPVAREMFAKLRIVRDQRPKPRRDEKILAGLNGMMIASFASAGVILADETYGKAAINAGEFIWNNLYDDKQGLAKSYFESDSTVSGELYDYAQLARGFLFLYDLTNEPVWLGRAKTLSDEMLAGFMDPQTGDFFATLTKQSFARTKQRGDSDKPSGNGVALDVLARLNRRVADTQTRIGAEKALAALSGIAAKSQSGGVSILAAADRHLRSENGQVQYAGDGVVRVAAIFDDTDNQLQFDFTVAPGWHVNAHKPLEDFLIATQLKLAGGDGLAQYEITWPEPEVKSLEFNQNPVAVLEGKFQISAQTGAVVSTAPGQVFDAELVVQSCSNKICLLPETLKFRLPRLGDVR